MDKVADEVEFLAMAVHANDPFLTIAQREGMMLCDAQCECRTYGLQMMARGEPPICRGVNRNRAKQEKRHGHISKKGKARLKDLAAAGQNWNGEALREDQSYVASALDKIKGALNIGGKPKTEEELLAAGMRVTEEGGVAFGEEKRKKKNKKGRK